MQRPQPLGTGTPLAEARLHGDELIDTPIGPIALVHGYFDDEVSKSLYVEMDHQRACQAYLWSTPLVSITASRFTEPHWAGTRWYKCFDFTIPQELDDRVELDERVAWFYEAVTSSEGMVNPVVGAGQVYMTTKRDSEGRMLRADRTYRLRVPKDVPARQFWGLTLYSESTRRAYDNGGTQIASTNLDSNMPSLRRNSDGSVDLYVGVKAPAGFESNFMKTVGEDGWFVIFRLYAPLQPFFDKTFTLPDFETI